MTKQEEQQSRQLVKMSDEEHGALKAKLIVALDEFEATHTEYEIQQLYGMMTRDDVLKLCDCLHVEFDRK